MDLLAAACAALALVPGLLGDGLDRAVDAVGLPGTGAVSVAATPVPTPGAGLRSGVGLMKGWRGTIGTRIERVPDSALTRVKPVDPSFFDWPALSVALADTSVPDFPLTDKSFNLYYTGNDL